MLLFLLSFSIMLSQECPPADTIMVVPIQDDWDIPAINSWEELEIMTWNIKTFPQTNNTVNDVEEIISDLLPDIINFQEITDYSAHQELADMLPEYEFIFPDNDVYYGLEIAFRKDCVDLISYTTLFNNNGYEFAWRYPLSAQLIWTCGEAYTEFEMINVHFKCCNDGFERRLVASEILSDYIDQQSENGQNVIAAGDFNDSLDDPISDNSLYPLIENNNVNFIDFDIAEGSTYNWSYPSYPSHIDHIFINSNIDDQNFNWETNTLRIDDYTGYNYYHDQISDHRPVYWKAFIPSSVIPYGIVINEIMNNPTLENEANGEWFELTNMGVELFDLYGLIIKDNDFDEHSINEHITLDVNEYLVFGSLADVSINGGIEVDYQYDNFNLANLWDEIIITHPSGILIDEVVYDYGQYFPNTEGASMMLVDSMLDNNDGTNWISSSQEIGNGDYGTPGYENTTQCNSSGDVNIDGLVNVVDVVLTINFILDQNNLSEYEQCQADLDQNSIINVVDIVLIVGYILDNE